VYRVGFRPLILIEAPSAASPRGTAGVGHTTARRGGDLRRVSTTPHQFDGGLDWHARTRDVCILDQQGESALPRHLQASPDALLKAMAPYRDARVLAVECLVTCDLAG
jgi:hypothetical protein